MSNTIQEIKDKAIREIFELMPFVNKYVLRQIKNHQDELEKAIREDEREKTLNEILQLEENMRLTIQLNQTNRSDCDKGYIAYQGLVLDIFEEIRNKLQTLTRLK